MSDKTKTIERNVVIKDINVHIKSVFGDKIPLTKALTNIAIQKLSISRRNNNKCFSDNNLTILDFFPSL